MTDDAESPVRACLARILEGKELPALSRQIIDAITAIDDDVSSLQRLANVVLREYSLTVSVVRTANSAHYRRAGRPVQSATHAMMMLGAATVRQLATSLLLFENYQRRSAGLRELMLLSLLTANHAREVAVRLGVPDAGEAHLCGMFRNLGEVLVAGHLPEEYAQIHGRMAGGAEGPARACSAVLGFQYEDLGVEICRQWGMPETVAQGMRARATSASSQVAVITAFSHDLTNVLYRRDGAEATPSADLDELLRQYAPRLRLSRDQARDVVAAALTETRELFLSAHVSIDALRLRELSDAAQEALGGEVGVFGTDSLPEVGASAATSVETNVPNRVNTNVNTGVDANVSAGAGTRETAGGQRVPESDLPALRIRLAQEVELAVDPVSGRDVGAVLLLALEAVLRGGPFDRVLACVLNVDRTRLTARAGLGVEVEALMTKFDFPMTARGGPVTAVLQQQSPLYLPADRALNLAELRWTIGSGIGQFGVFPLVVADTVIGCLYCDRQTTTPLPDAACLAHVRAVVRSVVLAIEERRRVASTGSALGTEAKAALVLRALRGETLASLASEAGVPERTLETWREAFLSGAMARLDGAS